MKQIFLPDSKSISNRTLVLAAISDKPTALKGNEREIYRKCRNSLTVYSGIVINKLKLII